MVCKALRLEQLTRIESMSFLSCLLVSGASPITAAIVAFFFIGLKNKR
jgi:hypothetical protein